MIELYTWPTPNGRKISIALEELGLEYRAHSVDITNGEQRDSKFLTISPNSKIPAIVDTENSQSLMESGAILLYLADKCGQLMPKDASRYWEAVEWIMWQMGGPGPILGQVHHFVKFNPGKSLYAEERYLTEGKRLYEVLNKKLQDREFVVGDYSIADIAIWPWVSR
ncbi:MAG: glutathione S-transferase N-terminal domain-containing protein, partial [Pseudomonadota bacterium]|nr:glutathione S-transferase N-terminal domain-containing protein [Pseudomonadota bacterium]